jgi:hypothetical protein
VFRPLRTICGPSAGLRRRAAADPARRAVADRHPHRVLACAGEDRHALAGIAARCLDSLAARNAGQPVPDGGGTTRAIDYSLDHWHQITDRLRARNLPLEYNHIDYLMRPWTRARNTVNSALMRSREGAAVSAPWEGWQQVTDTASHHHDPCRDLLLLM